MWSTEQINWDGLAQSLLPGLEEVSRYSGVENISLQDLGADELLIDKNMLAASGDIPHKMEGPSKISTQHISYP